jgi:hypothetical protein
LVIDTRSSVTVNIARDAREVKGFRGINPQAFHSHGHLFHVLLTALSSSAFCCLTEDHLNDYAHFIKRFADKKQLCVFVATKTTPMPLARGKLTLLPMVAMD